MSGTWALVRKEFQIDLRDRQAWSSVLLYVLATMYLVYLAFQEIIETETWNALLWVILLFTAFNVVSRTYDQDQGGRSIYLYLLASPRQVILAKGIYSSLFMLVVALVSVAVYLFFLPLPDTNAVDLPFYLSAVVLGGLGMTSSLGLISAIAWKTGGNSGMVSILGLPIIIPLMLAIIRYSEGILNGYSWGLLDTYAYSLLLLIALGTALNYVLMPFIWRD